MRHIICDHLQIGTMFLRHSLATLNWMILDEASLEMVANWSRHVELGCVWVWVDMEEGVPPPPAVVWPGSAWGLQAQIAACTITTLVISSQFTPFESGDLQYA